jgi:hypothetical protein
MTRETLGEIFQRSPQEALEEAFRREKEKHGICWNGALWCSQSLMGLDGKTRYGSWKNVTLEHLATRQYDIEFWDGGVCIFWTDVLHDPRIHRSVPKNPG